MTRTLPGGAGSVGVPPPVSRVALVSACQLLVRRDQNTALPLFRPFLEEALLYASKIRPPTITKEEIKASLGITYGNYRYWT